MPADASSMIPLPLGHLSLGTSDCLFVSASSSLSLHFRKRKRSPIGCPRFLAAPSVRSLGYKIRCNDFGVWRTVLVLRFGHVKGQHGTRYLDSSFFGVNAFPELLNGTPDLTEAFGVCLAALCNDGFDGLRSLQGRLQSGRRSIVEEVHGELANSQMKQAFGDDVCHLGKAVSESSRCDGESKARQIGGDDSVLDSKQWNEIWESVRRRWEAMK
jgi:hypothetical protein